MRVGLVAIEGRGVLGVPACGKWDLELILGLLILSVGIYAEVERQRHKTLEGIFLAPAVLLLLLGVTVFLVSFVGMVGSLRDNRMLLKVVRIGMGWGQFRMNEVFHSNIQAGIRHYYDDLDFKNILDFVQEKFSCCGGDEFRDWEVNQYHSCNGSGALACGVPHSCCIRRVRSQGVENPLIPGKTSSSGRFFPRRGVSLLGTIHVRGCIHAVGLWLKDNFEATLAIVCSLLLPQVRGGSHGNPLLDSRNSELERPTRVRDEPPGLGLLAGMGGKSAGMGEKSTGMGRG
uniref:Tetraspanin-15 n=1 Tax=Corvus moneduloides TaxID=1196302 RepID=A0A8U7NXF7_CORMO